MAIKSKGKTLTARQQAAKVREWAGWTREQYQKEYDKLRNRVRAYEKATGTPKGKLNVADILARDVRGRYFSRYYGEEYTPSNLYRAIQAAPSISSGKALKQAQAERIQARALEAINKQYAGFLKNSIFAQAAREEFDRLGAGSAYEYSRILKKYAELSLTSKQAIAESNKQLPPWEQRPLES